MNCIMRFHERVKAQTIILFKETQGRNLKSLVSNPLFLAAFIHHPNLHFFRIEGSANTTGALNRITPSSRWPKWLNTTEDKAQLRMFSGLGFLFAKVLSEYLGSQGTNGRVIGVIQAGIC